MIAFTTLIRAVEPSLELTGWSVLLRNYTTPVCLILELLQRRAEGAGYRMLSRWLKRCGIAVGGTGVGVGTYPNSNDSRNSAPKGGFPLSLNCPTNVKPPITE
jgi:hypothetical protein